MDVVAEEVERRHPGRWEGPFEEGARGVAFFDPDATNPTAAIVTENGMVCFSQPKIFYSWTELFPALARKYQADKIATATKDIWYVQEKYYRKLKGVWRPENKSDFSEHLYQNCKLDEDQAMEARVFIRENQVLDGLIPSLFDERDVVPMNGKQFLNCARVKPVPPHEEPQTWATNFPWIARFLELRFSETERQYFLAWWKRFYCSALQGDLLKGHSLFVVGETNLGKTLLSDHLVGASVGGHCDASKYMTTGTEFNKELYEVGLVTVNDGEVASDSKSHTRFSARVKSWVANPTQVYRAMYKDSQSIIYNGRLLVTLNDDNQSLNMVPDLATNMEDKCMVLAFQNAPYDFPPKHVLEPLIASELPYFLRWLADWQVPAEIAGDNRLGVKSYINETLRLKALNAGQAGSLSEIIDLWKKRNGFEGEYWTGTATAFYAHASADETLRLLLSKHSARGLGMRFAQAAKIKDSGIEVLDSDKHGNIYKINVSYDRERKAVRVKP